MSLGKDRNSAEFHLHKLLVTSAGSEDMTVNGSITAVVFEYQVPSGKMAEVYSFHVDIVDTAVNWDEFAGLGGDLTNGVKMEVIDKDGSTVLLDFTDGSNVKSNTHWSHFAGVTVLQPGTGDDALHARGHFKEQCGSPVVLSEGQYFRVTIQDNLTGVTHFECMIHGMIY